MALKNLCKVGNMLSNFLSVIIKISEIPLATSLDSSNFDAKELMLNVSMITLLTFLTLIFLRFESEMVNFIRTDFHYLRDKIDRFIIFSDDFSSFSDCLVLFGCQSRQVLFT